MAIKLHRQLSLPPLPILQNSDARTDEDISACKAYLDDGQQRLINAFEQKLAIRHLVTARAIFVNELLAHLWEAFDLHLDKASLIAVGGYGRGELHPGSDIDLLLLIDSEKSISATQKIQQFITFLWDIRLEIGHSVRTLKQCAKAAKEDITIATNLMESRLIAGNADLFNNMRSSTGPKKIWHAQAFFEAKVAEQKARYRKYQGTSFDLEPNLKGSPGGLRDIQLIGWIAKRHFKSPTLYELTNRGVFSLKEYRTLIGCQSYLWRMRFALHVLTGRGEDRLLFQHQKNVAEYLGYQDQPNALAVEQMMRKYFRAVITIRNLTELLLQMFEEVILEDKKTKKIEAIDEYFQVENDRIALKDTTIIESRPEFILKTFITAANVPGNKHVSAKTLRAIRNHRHLINEDYRNQPENKALFLEFFSIKHRGDRALFLMKRHGILARFLPVFEQISGQMQFDMFHAYTVDEHTLFLLKNISRFANPEYAEEFPICSQIMSRLEKPQLIFLAGLFHDIAKGRGGDHSELGAIDAYDFCRYLDINDGDAHTVGWLVQCHLLMSTTAQRKDLSDPEVIEHFAAQVNSIEKLELLYILTVADIRATSAKLWNSWKDSLLKELYLATRHYFESTTIQNLSTEEHIDAIKVTATELLSKDKVSITKSHQLWSTLQENYFKTTPVERIAWQTKSIIKHAHGSSPLVELKPHHNQGGTEIFIYTQDQPGLFAAITATLNRKNLQIQAAQLITNSEGKCLDTFVVLEESGKPITSSARNQSIKKLLQKNLKNIVGISKKVSRHLPKRFQLFDVPTEISFHDNGQSKYSQMELAALDQPGLLAAIGEALHQCDMNIHSARIVTLGEKVEDVFEISNKHSQSLSGAEQQQIKTSVITQFEKLLDTQTR